MRWKKLALILVVVAAVSVVVIGYFVNFVIYDVKDVSVKEVVSDPQSFDGVHVQLHGYVVDTNVYMFGPKYVLRNFEEGVEIALGEKGRPEKVDFEPYVSFVFDGENYTQIRNINVSVVGYVCYMGPVIDAPSFLLDVEKIEPQKAVMSEQQAIHIGKDFLDGIGYTTGKILFTNLEEKTPNFYWHDLAGLEKPDIHGLRLCWIIRFEQAYRPGHFFEAWIDAYIGEVIGGIQCR